MDSPRILYARVILPLPVEGDFTYILPDHLAAKASQGMRVIVPFGKRHYYTGIIESVSPIRPANVVNLKEVCDILDDSPVVRPQQIRFWRWMAEYYLCTVGEVFKAALPSGLKLESETLIELDAEAQPQDFAACSENEIKVLDCVRREGKINTESLIKKTELPAVPAIVSRLVERGLLCISEKLVERYRAVKRSYVRPTFERGSKEAMDAAFAAVKRSPKQEEVLVALMALSNFYKQDAQLVEVPMEVLMEKADANRNIVKALADKGLCEIYTREISRFSFTGEARGMLPTLSPAQEKAKSDIYLSFHDKDITLLHGLTGSGKTEVYIHLIDYVLQQGKQVLFLVPEIALTTQLTRRLQKVFADRVVIYHSKFSDNERVDQWKRLASTSEPCVVIGARSAVFLPISRLGLVIVDEEHEPSYKQYDPAPRYNGRDAAAVLASLHGAKTLFGSATPTVETYFKAQSGKFGLVSLTERYGNATLPQIEVVDMKAQRGRKAVSGYFSHRLLDVTLDSLNRKNQTIFFHNRRGYAPVARCKMCAFTPKCDFCDVSLTYHRKINRLCCHYCGAEYQVPTVCPECKEPAIEISGYGTERLEEELEHNFRNARILRMDLDTTRNKESYGHIIDEFSNHKADILVGTQMVTKGLDFADVDVVGILNADSLINFPDFRATERAFNMMEQVAGRAGRRGDQGKVLIQTYNPSHPLLEFVQNHDYQGYYTRELEERRAFLFPPFARIINIYLKHRQPQVVGECAAKFASALREVLGNRVSAPQEPPVSRVQSMYIRKIMLKVENGTSMIKVKELLRAKYIELASSPLMRGLSVYYDVDPV